MKKILVKIDGGLVSAVYSQEPVEVEVIDGDVDQLDDDLVIELKNEKYYVYRGEVNVVDKKYIDKVFKLINKAREEK